MGEPVAGEVRRKSKQPQAFAQDDPDAFKGLAAAETAGHETTLAQPFSPTQALRPESYLHVTGCIVRLHDKLVAGRRGIASVAATGGSEMELIRAGEIREFENSGVTSRQLLFPENSSSTRLTITRVTVKRGARNPPHRHATSEQVWVALRGSGVLHLEAGRVEPFTEGDVVRFEDGDLHGFENTGTADFEYLSVTAPPVNFRKAYERDWSGKAEK